MTAVGLAFALSVILFGVIYALQNLYYFVLLFILLAVSIINIFIFSYFFRLYKIFTYGKLHKMNLKNKNSGGVQDSTWNNEQ